MTSRLGKLFRRRTAVQSGRQNPVFLSTVDMSSKIYDGIPLRNFIGDDTRSELARELFLEINGICNALDPIVACREKLAKAMIKFASFQVLVIPAPPEADPSDLRSQPGISGELTEHLVQIAENNYELRSELYGEMDAPTFGTLWESLQRSYWQTYWFLETFNAARVELGDYNDEHDWFMPFKHAACANYEHIYRREINLPSVFDEKLTAIAPTAYSIFTDIVLSGAENPDLEWRDYYKDSSIPVPNFDR